MKQQVGLCIFKAPYISRLTCYLYDKMRTEYPGIVNLPRQQNRVCSRYLGTGQNVSMETIQQSIKDIRQLTSNGGVTTGAESD